MKNQAITNLEQLRLEKLKLKTQLLGEAEKLQTHYTNIERKAKPIISFLNFFGIGENNSEKESEPNDWKSLLKTGAGLGGAFVAGRFLYKYLGSTLLKTALTVGGTMLIKNLSDGSLQSWIEKFTGNKEEAPQH